MFRKERLLKDIDNSWKNWDEKSNFSLQCVGNLSPADLDTLELYAETEGAGLMKPLGCVGRVLEKYGYKHNSF